MTLRDWFAGQALAGLTGDNSHDMNRVKMAQWCYDLADAMLKARQGESE